MATWLQQLQVNFVEQVWYGRHPLVYLLKPLSGLFRLVVAVRRWCYRVGCLPSTKLAVPVVIVGNLSVGGTGKTPLLVFLAGLLKAQGYNPGIISRGYGGQGEVAPQTVTAASEVSAVGDEALLLQRRSGCPVVVGRKRVQAVLHLLREHQCDVVLADDGLQHYALVRDIEIAVVDGSRGFGNGCCLPAGPLREPLTRLAEVDFVVVNGQFSLPGSFTMQVVATHAVNLKTGELRVLSSFTGQACHALAGIGNPQRFFNLLIEQGIQFTAHKFPDHHVFSAAELDFNDQLMVLMTEKDAVKCSSLANEQHWYVPITINPAPEFGEHFLNLLLEKRNGY